MTNREEARKLYAGKTFYIKQPDGTLDGPRDDIYYANRQAILAGDHYNDTEPYAFVQVVDGRPVQMFKDSEILVKMENENGK